MITHEKQEQCVFLAQKDEEMSRILQRTLRKDGLNVKEFKNGSSCYQAMHDQRCDLVIADAELPGMNGIELLEKVKAVAPWMPVLITTAYADIPMVRKVFRIGAYDLLQKPFDREVLLLAVREGLKLNPGAMPPLSKVKLTRAEREVLKLLVEGKSTSEIARLRSRAKRTIDDQRRSLLNKLNVNDLANLIKRVAIVRFVNV